MHQSYGSIQQAGDELQAKTSRSSKPSKGKKSLRACCHMCENKFKLSYKDIPDTLYDDVLKYIDELVANPE